MQAERFPPANVTPECLALELHCFGRLAAQALGFLESRGYTRGRQHSPAGNTQNAITPAGRARMKNGDSGWLLISKPDGRTLFGRVRISARGEYGCDR
jgi:hypothetical protein